MPRRITFQEMDELYIPLDDAGIYGMPYITIRQILDKSGIQRLQKELEKKSILLREAREILAGWESLDDQDSLLFLDEIGSIKRIKAFLAAFDKPKQIRETRESSADRRKELIEEFRGYYSAARSPIYDLSTLLTDIKTLTGYLFELITGETVELPKEKDLTKTEK